jgi:hypothetical protein
MHHLLGSYLGLCFPLSRTWLGCGQRGAGKEKEKEEEEEERRGRRRT